MNPAGNPQDPDFTEREPRTHVAVPVLAGIELLSLESIDWIEAANHHVYLHSGTRRYLVHGKISDAVDRFGSSEFFQVNRSAVVRINRIAAIVPCGRDDVEVRLTTGVSIRMGRGFRRDFRKRFGSV